MKRMKRLSLLVLTVAVLVSVLFPVQAVQAAAKLNVTKKTLYVGDSIKLKVTGTTKTVSWSSSNKKVAGVSKKGLVLAKKKGTVTITATVGKKKLSCKVTVKNKPAFNATKAIEKISCKLYKTTDYVYAVLKNKYAYDLDLSATMVFYDEEGNMLDTSTDSNYAFQSGTQCVMSFSVPYDSDYERIEFDDCKINFTPEQASNIITKVNDIKITGESMGTENLTVEIKNNSNKDLSTIVVHVLFFNESGRCIGGEDNYAKCEKAGSIDYMTFDFPHDSEYNKIVPDSYKLFINNAYTYTWMD